MSSQKLTKKQKKGIAFRERKGKDKTKGLQNDGYNDIPIIEDQELDSLQAGDVEHEEDVAKAEGRVSKVVDKINKRKRKMETEEGQRVADGIEGPSKKKKKRGNEMDGDDKQAAEDAGQNKAGKTEVKQRYILFLGNLKYNTPDTAIRDHFSACDPPPAIRLLTPKAKKPTQSTTPKSKGCAFLEFKSRNSLQQALKLHHSILDGRKINVELTAGGGGKSEQRLNKLKERNKELGMQRAKRTQKLSASGASVEETQVQSAGPERFSSTSGLGETPVGKHTWTVGGGDGDDGKTRRRGQKRDKSGRKRPEFEATGVNAIPVGQ